MFFMVHAIVSVCQYKQPTEQRHFKEVGATASKSVYTPQVDNIETENLINKPLSC